jgi:hypothetical protein
LNKFNKLRKFSFSGATKKQEEIARELRDKNGYQCLPTSLISTANDGCVTDSVTYKMKDPNKRIKKLNVKIWDLLEYIDEYDIDIDKLETIYPDNIKKLRKLLGSMSDE